MGRSTKGAVPVKKETLTALQFQNALLGNSSELIRNSFLRFVVVAKPLRDNPTAEENIVLDYVALSKDCNEIFIAWENLAEYLSKANPVVLEALSLIIHVCTHNRQHRSSGAAVVRRVLRQRMRSVYSCVGSDNATGVKGALWFLVAAARHSGTCAKEIVTTFNFSLPALAKLPARRNNKEYHDIRTLFIEFMLALLSHNDASTVQSIMDANKMAILGMFKLISKDPLKLSSEVLHVCEAIAANPDVSKTTKVQILSAQTLDQISHMYHSTDSYTLDRDGHPTTNEITENEPTANQSVENNAAPNRDAGSDGEGGVVSMATDDGGRTPVVGEAHVKVTNGREVAHKFMMTVCASSTEGLIFTPKGPSDTKVHNPTLLKFITGQNKVNEDPLLQTLVLTILRNAPDILHGYLCAPTITLEAKVSMRLLSTLTLVTRVLQLPLPSGFVAALSTSTRTPTHAHVHVQGHAQPHTHAHARTVRSEVFADYMIPACMKATVVAQGLQSTSPLVKMSFTAALIRSLDKASTLLHSLPPHAHGTVRLCRDALLKRLPPFQVVVVGALQSSQTQYLQSLSAADEDERKGAKLVYLRSLQLVRRYIRCFPDSIKVNRYDMGKTIPTEMFGTTFDTHVTGTILSMLLEAPDVKWAYQRRSGSYASLLGQLIELLITSTHATVYALTRQLVTKIMDRTSMFTNNPAEIDTWLNSLGTDTPTHTHTHTSQHTQVAAVAMLEDALLQAYTDPYVYFDRLVEMMNTLADTNSPTNTQTEERDLQHTPSTTRTSTGTSTSMQRPETAKEGVSAVCVPVLTPMLQAYERMDSGDTPFGPLLLVVLNRFAKKHNTETPEDTSAVATFVMNALADMAGSGVPLTALSVAIEDMLQGLTPVNEDAMRVLQAVKLSLFAHCCSVMCVPGTAPPLQPHAHTHTLSPMPYSTSTGTADDTHAHTTTTTTTPHTRAGASNPLEAHTDVCADVESVATLVPSCVQALRDLPIATAFARVFDSVYAPTHYQPHTTTLRHTHAHTHAMLYHVLERSTRLATRNCARMCERIMSRVRIVAAVAYPLKGHTLTARDRAVYEHGQLYRSVHHGLVQWCLLLLHCLCAKSSDACRVTLTHPVVMALFSSVLPGIGGDVATAEEGASIAASVGVIMTDHLRHAQTRTHTHAHTFDNQIDPQRAQSVSEEDDVLQPLVGEAVAQMLEWIEWMTHHPAQPLAGSVLDVLRLLSSLVEMFGTYGRVPRSEVLLSKLLHLPLEAFSTPSTSTIHTHTHTQPSTQTPTSKRTNTHADTKASKRRRLNHTPAHTSNATRPSAANAESAQCAFLVQLLSVLARVTDMPAHGTQRLLRLLCTQPQASASIEAALSQMLKETGDHAQYRFAFVAVEAEANWFAQLLHSERTSAEGVHVLTTCTRFNYDCVRRLETSVLARGSSPSLRSELFSPLWCQYLHHKALAESAIPDHVFNTLLTAVTQRYMQRDQPDLSDADAQLFSRLVENALLDESNARHAAITAILLAQFNPDQSEHAVNQWELLVGYFAVLVASRGCSEASVLVCEREVLRVVLTCTNAYSHTTNDTTLEIAFRAVQLATQCLGRLRLQSGTYVAVAMATARESLVDSLVISQPDLSGDHVRCAHDFIRHSLPQNADKTAVINSSQSDGGVLTSFGAMYTRLLQHPQLQHALAPSSLGVERDNGPKNRSGIGHIPEGTRMAHTHKRTSSLRRKSGAVRTAMGTATSEDDAKPTASAARVPVLALAVCLARACATTDLSAEQLRVFLPTYTATLAPSDQLVTQLIQHYELRGISLGHIAYVWGSQYEDARAFADTMGQIGAKAAATFKCLDSRMLWASVRSFPFDRKLVAQSTELCGYEESPDYKRTDALSAVYDPAFVLPTVYQALLSSDDVDIRKLIESHVVGYCVSSLSSRDVHVRIAGSAVLRHLFDNHFKHSSFREQSQVQYLLSVFRDGIESNDQRVPTIMTVFVSEALLVLIAPDHAMYATVNKFILQRPYLPLDDVPLFYNMLLSGDDTSIAQQNWMLRWVTFGLVDESDWALYKRRHVGELLLSMSESRLSDKTTRQLVSEFFLAAVHIPGVANELFRSAGLVTWLFTRASLSAFDLAPIHRPGVPFDMPTYCRSEAGDEFEDTLQMAVLLWQRIDARSRQWPLVRETYQALLERAFRWINVNSQAMGEGECVNRCTILLVALAHLTDNEDIQPHTHTHTKTSTLSDTHTSTQKTHTHNTVHTRTKDPGGTPARPSALDATTPSPISIKPSVMESFVRTCILFGVVQPHTQSGGERVDYTHAPNMHRLVRVVCVAALDNCPLLSGGGGSSGIRNAEIESVIWLIQFCVSALSVGEDISLNSGRSALTLATNERARSINRMSGSIDFLVESVLGLVARRGAMGRAIRLSLTDIETGPSKMTLLSLYGSPVLSAQAVGALNEMMQRLLLQATESEGGLYTELKSELSRLQSGSGASPEAGVVALATAVQLQNLWQKSLGSDDVLCTA